VNNAHAARIAKAREELRKAERAVDLPFTRRRSLRIDLAIVELEAVPEEAAVAHTTEESEKE
jgi:hypothetical protein